MSSLISCFGTACNQSFVLFAYNAKTVDLLLPLDLRSRLFLLNFRHGSHVLLRSNEFYIVHVKLMVFFSPFFKDIFYTFATLPKGAVIGDHTNPFLEVPQDRQSCSNF